MAVVLVYADKTELLIHPAIRRYEIEQGHWDALVPIRFGVVLIDVNALPDGERV